MCYNFACRLRHLLEACLHVRKFPKPRPCAGTCPDHGVSWLWHMSRQAVGGDMQLSFMRCLVTQQFHDPLSFAQESFRQASQICLNFVKKATSTAAAVVPCRPCLLGSSHTFVRHYYTWPQFGCCCCTASGSHLSRAHDQHSIELASPKQYTCMARQLRRAF